MFMEMRAYTNVLHIVFELYLETLFSCELYPHRAPLAHHFFQMFYKMFSGAETDVQFEHPLGQ